MDAFVGEIRSFGFGFPPRGWMACRGQLLAVQSYSALFSIIGTQYGGNGSTTFQLPNLQGAVLNGQGPLPGGSTYMVGETGGTTGVAVTTDEMPAHTHTMDGGAASSLLGSTTPSNTSYISNSFSKATSGATTGLAGHSYTLGTPTPTLVTLNTATAGLIGGGQPHDNMAPYVGMNYAICLEGTFPQRN